MMDVITYPRYTMLVKGAMAAPLINGEWGMASKWLLTPRV